MYDRKIKPNYTMYDGKNMKKLFKLLENLTINYYCWMKMIKKIPTLYFFPPTKYYDLIKSHCPFKSVNSIIKFRKYRHIKRLRIKLTENGILKAKILKSTLSYDKINKAEVQLNKKLDKFFY